MKTDYFKPAPVEQRKGDTLHQPASLISPLIPPLPQLHTAIVSAKDETSLIRGQGKLLYLLLTCFYMAPGTQALARQP